ncbi:MAG TPA: DUF2911 domain-containing protein [Terriglobales bacterium]|nr:DUF2911 domain-containing protein [Terriglobales bacterium]
MRASKVVVYFVCAVFAVTVVMFAQTSGTSSQAGSAGTQSGASESQASGTAGQASGEHAQPQTGAAKKPASPRGQATFTFDDGKKISVDYGRPYMRNRKIMGGLVPYGKIWRTGANEATSFESEAALNIGGTTVPAGKYTLFTLPGENEWQLIINKQTGQWGTEYSQGQDVARIPMKVQKLDAPVDQFTVSFDKRGPNAGVMKLEWENISATVDFTEANQ